MKETLKYALLGTLIGGVISTTLLINSESRTAEAMAVLDYKATCTEKGADSYNPDSPICER